MPARAPHAGSVPRSARTRGTGLMGYPLAAFVLLVACTLPTTVSFSPLRVAPLGRGFPPPGRPRARRALLALRSQAPQVPERNVLSIRVDERDVYLVGTMHYNPTSLQRVGDTIDAVAGAGTLSSVVIESCASRYEKWKDVSPDSLSRRMLESEMQVACDRAKAAGVELILGDQSIEDVGARTKELFSVTVRDLLSPLQVFRGRRRAAASSSAPLPA
jgi:hypothetical protein